MSGSNVNSPVFVVSAIKGVLPSIPDAYPFDIGKIASLIPSSSTSKRAPPCENQLKLIEL